MANNIAPELPVLNDALFWCRITRREPNETTGDPDKITPVTGLVDVVAFPSTQEELKGATTIHASLTVTLSQLLDTNVYYGYLNGDTAAAHLIPDFEDEVVFIHFHSPSTRWHEVARTIIRNKRTAT